VAAGATVRSGPLGWWGAVLVRAERSHGHRGDFVTRFVVRLRSGIEVQVKGPEQARDDQKWLTKLGRHVPCERQDLPTAEVPWTLRWYELTCCQ